MIRETLHQTTDGPSKENSPRAPIIAIHDVSIAYGSTYAIRNVTLPVVKNEITGIIGGSGCGKSTLLRAINRMNDLYPNVRLEGKIMFGDVNLYAKGVDPVWVRRTIGMVFQKPNPFPKSVFDNVAYGLRLLGVKGDELKERVVQSLKEAYVWDEVKDVLHKSALKLSGGQQQRVCIARTLAVEPDVILLDEPCSSLDPIATGHIEMSLRELKKNYTLVIVTHNMRQAERIADSVAFFNTRREVDRNGVEHMWGVLEELGTTDQIFRNPSRPETADYIAGRRG